MSEPRSISVALCTYNGLPHLREQLRSLATQTRLPTELVVGDDGSTDGTPEAIEAFARGAPFPVRLQRNARRLGSTANFAETMSRCSSDLIALCDQDDSWLPSKLARLAGVLEDLPEAGAVFSDAELVNETGRPLHRRLLEGYPNLAREGIRLVQFQDVLRQPHFFYGTTMMLRRDALGLVLPIPPQWGHDTWAALLIAARSTVAIVPEPLVAYRQHAAQQVSFRALRGRSLLWQARKARGKPLADVVERLRLLEQRVEARGAPIPEDRIAFLREKLEHLELRLSMPRPRLQRLPRIARMLHEGQYHRHSAGWASAMRDALMRRT